MRTSMSSRAGRQILVLSAVMILAVMQPISAGAGRIAAYLFDGTPGTQNPSMVEDAGGDALLDLSIGSSAEYNVDSPFSGETDTSLDVSGGLNERAENISTDTYKFDHQNQAWSITMWVKGVVQGGYAQIVGQRKASTGNGWYAGVNSSGEAFVFTQGLTAAQARGVSGGSNLFDSQWHHIVVVNDPASDLDGNGDGEILLYVDNSAPLTHKKVITESPPDYGNSVFCVGTGRDLSTGTYNQFSGRVDEVAVFSHALTAQEVDFYFNNSLGSTIEISFNTVAVTNAAIFEFESFLGLTYRLDRATTLGPPDDFSPTGSFLEGNGSTMTLADPSGPSSSHIYRIVIP